MKLRRRALYAKSALSYWNCFTRASRVKFKLPWATGWRAR